MTEPKVAFRCWARQHQEPVDEEKIRMLILQHPWYQEADTVMAYCAIPPEIDLMPLLRQVLADGKTLALPRCQEDGTMTARRITAMHQLLPGAYGILEPPEDAALIPPEAPELILVPGLAFDRTGGRMGRGKGFYDRFLAHASGRTIGLSRCLVPQVPVEKHDIKMNAVVTEEKILICEMEDSPC